MAFSSDINIFEEVAKKADILKVVSHYISVEKQGNKYKALCPFHNDHHPSRDVNVTRNTFKCWVCGEGGDAISFVEKFEKISPIEALKKVCDICQIPYPSSLSNFRPRVDRLREDFPKELEAIAILSEYYSLALTSNEGKEAKDYLSSIRKIPDEVIKHFHLGYAPKDSSKAIQVLKKKGISTEAREKAGILSHGSIENDRYCERIRFPIEDNDGHIVAFSGRRFLPDQQGEKYVNSPESVLFKKKEVRYHFYEAKEEARKSGYLYLVEGFMDAIAFVRAGIRQVAALRGTALTSEHLAAIKDLHCEVRLCLDSDEAGQSNEERAVPLFYDAGIPFRILRRFKGGKDADEVLTKYGQEELKSQAKRRYDPFLFLLGRRLNGRMKREDSQEISSFLSKNARYYQSLNDVAKAQAIEALSKVTNLKDDVLVRILNNESLPLPETKEKDKGGKPFVRYPKPFRRKETYDYPKERARNRADNYKQADAFDDVFKAAMAYPDGGKRDEELRKNETQLILVLPLSRDATSKLQESRLDFSFRPFFDLANRIGNLFLGKTSLSCFDADTYKTLEEQVSSADNGKKEEDKAEKEEEDEFGFSEDDLGSYSFSKEEQAFLLYVVKLRKRLSPSLYSGPSFHKAILVHGLIKEKIDLLNKIKLEKGGKRDVEDAQKLARLDLKIRSPRMNLKS